ncbi:MAG: hypothetical protein PSY14_11805 [bacterium]|nr:hypothetical protein [bacterium]
MQFFAFISIFFATALFHQREHRLLVGELRDLHAKLVDARPSEASLEAKLKGEDWRLVSLRGTKAGLRRAFEVPGMEAMLRYGVPVVMFCLMLLGLQSWIMPGIYAGVMTLKWFVSVTVLDTDPYLPRYEVRMFGLRLFGEGLAMENKNSETY